ncbi:MAG: hypothetical protein GF331_25920 [Chitinivibrionales bacterium]|nr:hypothetical protein [Chitinivibrionales bacterium]
MSPIRLCHDNPHYLERDGKPLLLISSAEHYGSLLNLDFDFEAHLDTLASYGFNQARVFSGTYREVPSESFGITDNTLAPAEGRYCCPWKRSAEPGYVLGGNRFDLDQWDPTYLERLQALVAAAGMRNVVLEIVLFCYLYYDGLWEASPLNAASNVNGVGAVERGRVYTLEDKKLLAAQEAVTRHIVEALRDADNVYFELMNEPYSINDGSSYLPWQRRITDVIVESEKDLRHRHLIAQNFRNHAELLTDVHPAVSICSFHYAGPEAVTANYHLDRVIADDETGFSGNEMAPYRHEAWNFIIGGGGLFSHLDYSFTVEKPDGTHAVDDSTPGIGGHYWRKQLKVLRDFMDELAFWRMRPASELQPTFKHPPRARILAEPGVAYAAYIDSPLPAGEGFSLFLPAGAYRAEWIVPEDGSTAAMQLFGHDGGSRELNPPPFPDDIALRVVRVDEQELD